MRRPSRLAVEALESRTTPTVTIVNATTATFTDVDGDLATVRVSKGTLTAGLFTTVASGSGDQLQTIDLSGGGFDGASLAITVRKAGSGDGHVNVGYINSTGHDLGAVSVAGDLGRIDAGDNTTTPAIKSLTVASMGTLGVTTQAAGGTLSSNIIGALGSLTVAGDVNGASIDTTNSGAKGKIGGVRIGGSLIGGTTAFAGSISSGGDMAAVRIGQDLKGGKDDHTGSILSQGKLAGVTIGGSILGGSGDHSGYISAVSLGRVRVGKDVTGGAGLNSGMITGGQPVPGIMGPGIAGVTIGGNLTGGAGDASGLIANGLRDIGPVRIGGNLQGGSISGTTGDLTSSGSIASSGRLVSVTIGGSIISGTDSSTGGDIFDTMISAGSDIGSITVKGDVIGNSNANGDSPVTIAAVGKLISVGTSNVAIGSISIGGKVEFAKILGGYGLGLAGFSGQNADAQIGRVSVGGDWIASSLVAGVDAGADGLFGTADDAKITGGTDDMTTVSKIGSIRIGGQVQGTAATGDHFGFVAEQIGSFKVGTTTTALKPGVNNDVVELLGSTTADVTIREVA
jgi:hypothetical protein